MKLTTFAILGAVCLVGAATSKAIASPFLQAGSESNSTSQQYLRGTLSNCRFGSAAAAEIKNAGGEITVLAVNDASKFNVNGNANAILSNLAQYATNKKVFAVGKRENGAWLLISAWDEVGFDTYRAAALKARGGYMKNCTADMIKIGEYYFACDKATQFIKAGKISKGINVFSDNSMVHIKAELKKGVPHATVVSDSQADVGQDSAGNNRPDADRNTRPGSANSGKPPLGSPSERPNGGTTAGGNNRPTSANSGKPQTNSPSERASKPKYKVTMYFKICTEVDLIGGVAGQQVDNLKDGYGLEDKRFELFGSLAIDGKTFWSIPEKQSRQNQRKLDEKLAVKPKANSGFLIGGQFIVQTTSIKLTGSLMDFDAVGKSDELLKVNKTINLEEVVGKSETAVAFGSANLYIKVERA